MRKGFSYLLCILILLVLLVSACQTTENDKNSIENIYLQAQKYGYNNTINMFLYDLSSNDNQLSYESVKLNGFSGTFEQWTELLKGEDGKSPFVTKCDDGYWYVDGAKTPFMIKPLNGDSNNNEDSDDNGDDENVVVSMADFDGIIDGVSFAQAEVNPEFTSANGTLTTAAKSTTGNYFGYIATGNKAGSRPNEYTVLAVINGDTKKIEGIKILQEGATSSSYNVTEEAMNMYKEIEIADPTAFDGLQFGAGGVMAGATESASTFKNAMMVIAQYYATYELGAVDPSLEIIEKLNALEEGVTYEKGEVYDYTAEGIEVLYHFNSSAEGKMAYVADVTVTSVYDTAGKEVELSESKTVRVAVVYDESDGYEIVNVIVLSEYTEDTVTVAEYVESRIAGKSKTTINGLTTKKQTNTAEKAAVRLLALDSFEYSQAGTGKYFDMLATVSDATFTQVSATADTTLGTIKFAATANDSKYGPVAGIIVTATSVGANPDITLIALVSTVTDQVVAFAFNGDITTSGYSPCPTQEQLEGAYLNVDVSTATAFDDITDGIVSGATNTSDTIKNAFKMVAQVYSENLETLSLGTKAIVEEIAPGATATELKENNAGENAVVLSVYANADTTVYVVYGKPQGIASNAGVFAVAVKGGKITAVKMISDPSSGGYSLSQQTLDKYVGTDFTSSGLATSNVQTGTTFSSNVLHNALLWAATYANA